MSVVTPSPTRHTVRRLGATLLRLAGIYWAIAVTAVVVANVVGGTVWGSTDVSIAVYARQSSIWFPFSLAIMLVTSYLRVHVAAGMTRRTFVRASLLVQVAAGVGYAVALTTLVQVERLVHDALGWSSTITEIQLTTETSPAWAMALELAVVFVVGNLCGLLVGATYQRFGGWVGTLTLPLTVGPLVLALYIPGARITELPGVWTTTEAGHLGLLVAAGVLLGAAIAAAYRAVVLRLQLAPAS